MSDFTRADIIPLIGGLSIGSDRAFGGTPDYLMSFKPFAQNDAHIVNHYNVTLGADVPYHSIDDDIETLKTHRVDVVSSTCPCAGLSQAHQHYGADRAANDWMYVAAEYVLGVVKPQVYWGENAPALAGAPGRPVRERLRAIAGERGYTMSTYRTRSLLHGTPQVRERSFYFFWRGDKTPVLNFFREQHETIESVISGAQGNFQTEPINPKTPSEDPFYRYVLEVVHGGIGHAEFAAINPVRSVRYADVVSYVERHTDHTLPMMGEWLRSRGYGNEADHCARWHAKQEAGGQVRKRTPIVPRDRIGAFVLHYPMILTHPTEDRFISYREAMTIMGLPSSFELLRPTPERANHICQNVPVKTAADMAGEVRAALECRREWLPVDYLEQHNIARKNVEGWR